MSQFYCRENDLILFHTSSSSLPKLPDQSTALLYLRLLRHSFVILNVALRTKRKIFSYKIQKPLLKRNLKKDA